VSLLGTLGGPLALSGDDSQLRPHLWTREGATWSEVPGLDVRDALYAAAADGDAAWVGGSNGALYRVEDGGLTSVRRGVVEDISSLAVGPDGSAYAVTSSGCGDDLCLTTATHLLQRGADGTWSVVPGFTATVPLRAVAVRSAGDVFLAGDQGGAWHYDGTNVNPVNTFGGANVNALRVCGGDVWLVGDRGLVSRFDGAAAFNPVGGLSGTLRAISCPSADDIWVAGDYSLSHFDGQSWSAADTGGINNQPWRAVYASSEEVWVTGETNYLLHCDRISGACEAIQDPAGLRLHGGYGLWASGPGDLYLVGSQQRPREAVLLRYDGAQWYALDAATDHALFAIDGSGPGEFFIGGTGGAILKAAP
jgi:hypothetical protein